MDRSEAVNIKVLKASGLTAVSARMRGRSHKENGTPCQDYCLCEQAGDLFVVCAADGHGGEEYIFSDLGSEIACESLVRTVKDVYGGDMGVFARKAFRDAVIENWKKDVLDFHGDEIPTRAGVLKKYGTTLLFAIVGEKEIALGQIGDGAILLFDDHGRHQLFVQNGVKITSSTSSLVSSRAEYAFISACFPRNLFPCILLSTDGIYDRLDTGDAFHMYGQARIRDLKEHGTLREPFAVEGIDVSDYTWDDCTAVLAVSDIPSALPYRLDCVFVKAYEGIALYGKDGMELHDTPEMPYAALPETLPFTLLKHTPSVHGMHAYEIPEGSVSVQGLLECREHLQKRPQPRYEDRYSPWDNCFWWGLYQRLRGIRDFLAEEKILPQPWLFQTARVHASGTVFFHDDAFPDVPFDEDALNALFEGFLEYFGFIGELSVGSERIPLYRWSAGIPSVRFGGETFTKVVRSRTGAENGLWNQSMRVWHTPLGDYEPGTVVPLMKDMEFDADGIPCAVRLLAGGDA